MRVLRAQKEMNTCAHATFAMTKWSVFAQNEEDIDFVMRIKKEEFDKAGIEKTAIERIWYLMEG